MASEKFEIHVYAQQAVENNLTVKEIMLKVSEQNWILEQFLISFTFFKTGKFNDENFKAVVSDFKKRAQIEQEKIASEYIPDPESLLKAFAKTSIIGREEKLELLEKWILKETMSLSFGSCVSSKTSDRRDSFFYPTFNSLNTSSKSSEELPESFSQLMDPP